MYIYIYNIYIYIYHCLYLSILPTCCDLAVVERLACFYDPESDAGGSLRLLAGSNIPDWSWVRSETKGSAWSSRLGVGRGANNAIP